MQDNNNTQNGGHLLTSCYGSWSDTIAKFAQGQQPLRHVAGERA